MVHRLLRGGIAALVVLLGPAVPAGAQSFVNFESGHVRPLALSPDGTRLFAVNTPDNRLTIFDVTGGGLTLRAEVPVGMEPVAVAARSNTEVWVVNHVSDSISIVTIDTVTPALSRVTRTLLTCDEPRDIVFAGPGGNRAFVTTARRGQNCPVAANLTTPGIGRALVQVFDANNLGVALGGTPLTTITLFGDTPRALARSADGSTVYAAVFHSGNRTTALNELTVAGSMGLPPAPPGSTPGAPSTGLIVKFNPAAGASGEWRDELNRNWNASVPFSLPDRDVFAIDANAGTPAETGFVVGAGTVLFNMAVRPDNGKLYVTNLEAKNEVRFEPVIRGHIAESRITVVSGLTPTPRHLNPHIDYNTVPGPPSEVAQSLAFPTQMAFSSDGQTVYVTAFGSGKVGVLDTDDLEAGIITESQVDVGGGPTGLALDEANDRLYVMNRFDETISIIGQVSQPLSRAVTGTVSLRYDPSPAIVRDGRRFLYDAKVSGHGDSACASCHIFGDFDSLAWDLGDPFGTVVPNPNPFRLGGGPGTVFHPMKGPMTTQSLRGMAGFGPMHWRGDRTGGSDPGGDPMDEDAAFKKFNGAFVGLLGNATELSAADMQAYTDFILTVAYPPSPIRAFDLSFTAAATAGFNTYINTPIDSGLFTCQQCHLLPFGTDGFSSFENEPQEAKIAHFRNLYQKVGMFGVAGSPAVGNQVRGFGYLHDGSVSTVFDFLHAPVFTPINDTIRRNLEEFVFAANTGLKSVVGQQVSATAATFSDATVINRIALLIQRAAAAECDVVVKGNFGGESRGWLFVSGSTFRSDRASEALIDKDVLRAQAAVAGQELTYTAVPPGSGTRMALDRDLDGFFDRTELDAGSDPAAPDSTPGSTTSTTTTTTTTSTTTTTTLPPPRTVSAQTLKVSEKAGLPASRRFGFLTRTGAADPANHRVAPPLPGSAGDPSLFGAVVQIYNSAGSGEIATFTLPAAGWRLSGSPALPKGWNYRAVNPTDAVGSALLRYDKIKVSAGGAAFTYSLDEASQGRIAVRLTTGTALPYCTDVAAKASGAPPSTAANDHPGKFIGQKSPAPSTCPAVP